MGVFDMGGPTAQTDPTASNFMPVFDALDADAQGLANADPLDLTSMTAVTNAVDAIEDLNAVISGGPGDIAAAIAGVRATMEADVLGSNSTVADHIMGGAGLGLVAAAGEQPSPVNLGMAQRMDDLFEAMSDTQVAAVQTQIVGSGATDIVGALSAMGVFDMGGPTAQTDPTASNFMPVFDALDDDAQAIVLKNADPLDLNSMTTVTNAVDAIEDLNVVLSGETISGTALSSAISAVSTAIAATPASADTLGGLSPSGQFIWMVPAGIIKEAGEPASPVTLEMAQRMDDLFTAMSPAQQDAVALQIQNTGGVVDIVGGLSAMGVLDMNELDPTASNFMPVFDALDADAQALVLANADPLDLTSMTAVTNAVDAIEDLNAVISGGPGDIAAAIAGVRATMEADVLGSNSTVADHIMGGAGLGLVAAAGEQPSPVNLGMAQRMDDLFEAMSDTQVAAVQAQIVGSGATDIVGALSAMGVFDMGGPTAQTDPTASNFMPVFDALDADTQAIVLKNADPLDLTSMTTVTNAVDAIEDLNVVLSGETISGTALSSAISAVIQIAANLRLRTHLVVCLRVVSSSWMVRLGIIKEAGEPASPVTLEMAQRMDDLFTAMSPAQQDAVALQIQNTGGVVDIVGGLIDGRARHGSDGFELHACL